jgi:hypothetical protein
MYSGTRYRRRRAAAEKTFTGFTGRPSIIRAQNRPSHFYRHDRHRRVTHARNRKHEARRWGYGGRLGYRSSLASTPSARFLARALSAGALGNLKFSFVSTCIPTRQLDKERRRRPVGFAPVKIWSCAALVYGSEGRGEHHTQAPCALAPTLTQPPPSSVCCYKTPQPE